MARRPLLREGLCATPPAPAGPEALAAAVSTPGSPLYTQVENSRASLAGRGLPSVLVILADFPPEPSGSSPAWLLTKRAQEEALDLPSTTSTTSSPPSLSREDSILLHAGTCGLLEGLISTAPHTRWLTFIKHVLYEPGSAT